METNANIDSCAIFEGFTLRKEIDKDKTVRYYDQNNHLHRNFGPAVIFPNGNQCWYNHGKLHRLDGPAVIAKNGNQYWYINGKYYSTEEDYWKKLKEISNGN